MFTHSVPQEARDSYMKSRRGEKMIHSREKEIGQVALAAPVQI